ncbi:MAG: hypothetical protein ACD_76C00101G0007 [uncultured bacterium]|nr:MAG: hypothetical protein ACD_76C00101G0007 [uncultured bacterium]HBD05682.1 hypothetical protein [Candidatus Uhrbacteria bacterium]
MNEQHESERGFTLIEFLVVAAIIGILAVFAVYALSTARSTARDAKRLSDIRSTQASLELYFHDKNTYPVLTEPVALGIIGQTNCLNDSNQGFTTACDSDSQNVYMDNVSGQIPNGLDRAVQCSANSNAYCYYGNDTTYRIEFELEKSVPGTDILRGANCATPDEITAGKCQAI